MALFEGKTPAERNKLIAALILPALALVFVVRMLFFSSGPARTTTPANANSRANTSSVRAPSAPQTPAEAAAADDLLLSRPVSWQPAAFYGHDAGRNIFAFYEPPPKPSPTAPPEQVPTPPPPPPLVVGGITPPTVYARTGDFTLQVSGDKFTPEARVYLDGQEQQTQYRNSQQLTAKVPAAIIAAPGPRKVEVRTPDGRLYSNEAALNVMQPPAPTYTFVGLLSRRSYETAVLKDQRGELYSVRAGDLVEGRFRVTAINDRGVEVVDKDLNVKHTMPFVQSRSTGGGPVPGSIQPPPPPPPPEEVPAEAPEEEEEQP
ncbi:MAG TPA: hypothetical protein VG148_06295 [Pyrinomonadaceae bacterium]|nr:hypothetical protein [Pyrinomonadaceae bacterium]